MSTSVIFLCVFLVLLQSSDSEKSISSCPPSAKQNGDMYLRIHGNVCYQFVLNRQVDYITARKSCQSLGGMLALPKTLEINNFFSNTLVNDFHFYGNGLWIGLNDIEEFNYIWEDGTKLSDSGYTNWGVNQGPFGGIVEQRFEDCVALDPKKGGTWYDYECADTLYIKSPKLSYICAHDISTQLNTTSPHTTSISSISFPTSSIDTSLNKTQIRDICPTELTHDGNWTRYFRVLDDVCYNFVLTQRTNYDQARSTCTSHGGTLAVIKNMKTNTFLQSVLKNVFLKSDKSNITNIWIGLRDVNNNEKWHHYQWDDGSYLDTHGYTYWDNQQNSSGSSAEKQCVVMNTKTGYWSESICGDENSKITVPFICQYTTKDNISTVSSTTVASSTVQDSSLITSTVTSISVSTKVISSTIVPSTNTLSTTSSFTVVTSLTANSTPTSTTVPSTTSSTTTYTPTPATTSSRTTPSTTTSAITSTSTSTTSSTTTTSTPSTSTEASTPSTTTEASNPSTITEAPTTSTSSTTTGTDLPTTLCPPFICSLDCGFDGYVVDSRGCSVCKCES